MFYFARSNSKRESTEGTVGGCVGVTADAGCTGEGETLFGTDYVDNTWGVGGG